MKTIQALSLDPRLRPGVRWRHIKTDGIYEIVAEGFIDCDGTPAVVYRKPYHALVIAGEGISLETASGHSACSNDRERFAYCPPRIGLAKRWHDSYRLRPLGAVRHVARVGLRMKVLDRSHTPIERPKDEWAVIPPDPRACLACGGWGYPSVNYFPEKINGKWAMRCKSKPCRKCDGSGLAKSQSTEAERGAARAYHRHRLNQMTLWLGAEMERRGGKAN